VFRTCDLPAVVDCGWMLSSITDEKTEEGIGGGIDGKGGE